MRWTPHAVAALLAVVALGCGSDEVAPPPPPDPVEGCAPGELELGDGSCRPAGMQPQDCAEGFAHDGDVACLPLLPAMRCEPGSMAIPGDGDCREVAPCAAAPWGDAPLDGATQYVDGSYAGMDSDGSAARPWLTIQDAVDAASAGALIAIAAGSYPESPTLSAPVRLWGRCPSMVELTGALASNATIVVVGSGASGTLLHGVALHGQGVAVAAQNAEVTLESSWLHDLGDIAVTADDAEVRIADSLIERARHVGVFASGSTIQLERSLVRDTVPNPAEAVTGAGVVAQPSASATSSLEVTRSLLEGHSLVAIFVGGGQLQLEASVLRDTLPASNDGTLGVALSIQPAPTSGGDLAVAQVAHSHLEGNHAYGALVLGSTLVLDSSVIRATQVQASDSEQGVAVHGQVDGGLRASVTVTGSLLSDNHTTAISSLGGDLSLTSSVVRQTQPNPAGLDGVGVTAIAGLGERPTLHIVGSRIEDSYEGGVVLDSGDLVMQSTLIQRTQAQLGDATGGVGLSIQNVDGPNPNALVEHTEIRDSRSFGMVVSSASLDANDLTLAEVAPRSADGTFGDGMAVISFGSVATARIRGGRIEASARAGISNFGAIVELADATLECNPIQLAAQSIDAIPFDFDDGGGNRCGCAGESQTCALQLTDLQAPEPP